MARHKNPVKESVEYEQAYNDWVATRKAGVASLRNAWKAGSSSRKKDQSRRIDGMLKGLKSRKK